MLPRKRKRNEFLLSENCFTKLNEERESGEREEFFISALASSRRRKNNEKLF
jgi:hypothetical protein